MIITEIDVLESLAGMQELWSIETCSGCCARPYEVIADLKRFTQRELLEIIVRAAADRRYQSLRLMDRNYNHKGYKANLYILTDSEYESVHTGIFIICLHYHKDLQSEKARYQEHRRITRG